MSKVLVDSNVLLDLILKQGPWYEWSRQQFRDLANRHTIIINPIIYAELSVGFDRIEDLDDLLSGSMIEREDLPWDAAFLAGKCFLQYRKRGGAKTAPLPDFYIGAHATIHDYMLLSRDKGRYTSYFPKINLISPENS